MALGLSLGEHAPPQWRERWLAGKENIMAVHKDLSALAILACITVAVAAVGQQPPMSENPAAYGKVAGTALGLPGSQQIPASTDIKALRGSQDYGLFVDPHGVRIP